MYAIIYGYQICLTVTETLFIFDIPTNEYIEGKAWNPHVYMLILLLIVFITVPVFLHSQIIEKDKWETIKRVSAYILERSYGFKKQ